MSGPRGTPTTPGPLSPRGTSPWTVCGACHGATLAASDGDVIRSLSGRHSGRTDRALRWLAMNTPSVCSWPSPVSMCCRGTSRCPSRCRYWRAAARFAAQISVRLRRAGGRGRCSGGAGPGHATRLAGSHCCARPGKAPGPFAGPGSVERQSSPQRCRSQVEGWHAVAAGSRPQLEF